MTGEKNKSKTLEKMWSLDDNTLKTPEHDKLVCMLLDKENLKKYFPIIEALPNLNVNSSCNSKYFFDAIYNLGLDSKGIASFHTGYDRLDETEMAKVMKERFEKEKGYDLHHSISEIVRLLKKLRPERDKLLYLWKNNTIDNYIKIDVEKIITNRYNKFIIGYWDAVVTFHRYYIGEHLILDNIPATIHIEVKPKIESFGATLRQINTYIEYSNFTIPNRDLVYLYNCSPERCDIYVLFTPDTKFDSQFKSQGIKVVHPEQYK